MRKCRRSGILCLLLVCSVMFMGILLPVSASRVSASTHANSRQMSVAGTTVNIEENSYSQGMLRFKISLGGCSTYKSATIYLVLSSGQIPVRSTGRNGTAYASVSGRYANTTARANSPSEITITTSNRQMLDGEISMSFSVSVMTDATIAGASVSSVEEYKETIKWYQDNKWL